MVYSAISENRQSGVLLKQQKCGQGGNVKRFFVISATILAFTASANAACVDTFGVGARATALGGAYAATADDPFAVYYNPAGLTQIDAPTTSVGVTMLDPALKLHGFNVKDKDGKYYDDGTRTFSPTSFGDDSDPLFVPHAGFAMPINNQVSLGIAAYLPYGLDVEWEKNTTKNPSSYNFYHSYYMREVVTPTVAYKINDKFSLGFGVSIGKSKSGAERILYYPTTASQAAPQIATAIATASGNPAAASAILAAANANGGSLPASHAAAGTYNTLIGLAAATNSLNGKMFEAEMEDDVNYSFNLGLMYKPTNSLSLGLAYRSKTDTDFEGDIKLDKAKIGKVKMDYDHPDQVQVGVRYRPHDKISMEADFVWTNWRHNEYQNEIFTSANPLFNTPKEFQRDWKNTNQIRLGIEWQALDFLAVRGGYFYDPTPIPDNTFDMMWPDADRKTYSIGLGLNFAENWTLDTSFQYAIAEASRIIGGESENINSSFNPLKKYNIDTGARTVSGEADGHLYGYSATMNYKF